MQQVFDFIEKWAQRGQTKPAIPAQASRMLTFDFVGEDLNTESELPFEIAPASSCLGRTESCLSSTQLSDSHCLDEIDTHQSSNLVYLQHDVRESEASKVRKARRYNNPKVRATAMLDSSDLIEMRQHRHDNYSRFRAEHTASKQVSLEVLRKLGQRSSREELLEKIKDACDKVSAEALINSPGRRPQTGPLRQTICIQIG